MKTKYKWLEFVEYPELKNKKTKVYAVIHKDSGDDLGEIKWFGRWRQYCFFPDWVVLFSRSCLRDIADFIDQLMEDRKK